MATRYLTIKGFCKWAKLYEPDSYAGAERWQVNIYPFDDKEWEKFRSTGLELKEREDQEGKKFITLRRPTKKLIKEDLVIFSPPEITGQVNVSYLDEEGNKVRQYNKGDGTKVTRHGEPVNIGNESLVLANFCYYDTAKGKGHRLENINVLELMEYVGTEAPAEEPKKEEPVKVTAKPSKKEELNDSLDSIPW